MELEDAEEEQYCFEEVGSSRFSHTEEQSDSMTGRFTDFDKRDIEHLREVIRDSQGLPPDEHSFGKPEITEQTDKTPSNPKHLSKYRRYSEEDDDDLGDEPFDDEHWVHDEQSALVEEELQELRGGMRFSILEHLTEMPDIDEISSSISEETIVPVEEPQLDVTLIGKFVDPLTGLDIEEPEKIDDLELDFIDIEEYEEEQHEQLDEVDITEDSELLELQNWDVDMEEIEETKLAQEEEQMLDFELVRHFMTTKQLEFDEALLEDTLRQNEAVVAAFVEELIQLVVEEAQYKDPRDVLRKSIDKRKLMDEINEKLRELEIEQSVRLYLNRKVVDHLKRKRAFRAIMEDPPQSIDYFMTKYREQLQKYDEVMGKEEELKNVTKLKTGELNMMLKQREHEYEEEAKEFERVVKKTLLPYEGSVNTTTKSKVSEKYKEYTKNINDLLDNISTKRKEISHTRLALIKNQHLFAELKQRLSEIVNLGNGLNLSQFENLQNEVKQMSKKLEERNTELTKARLQRQLDVHINTHMKERTLMLRNTLAVQKLSYSTLQHERDQTRRGLYKQKVIRAKIRKDIKELDFQGGLLSKPALMLDYDNTVAEVEHKKEIVKGLHYQYKKIIEKIAQFEQMLASGVPNKLTVTD